MKREYNYLRRIFKDLLRWFRTGRKKGFIFKQMEDTSDKFKEEALRDVYVKLHTNPDKEEYTKLIDVVTSDYEKFTDNLQSDIREIMKRGIEKDNTVDEMSQMLSRRINKAKHSAKNLSETTIGGINRAKRMEDALEAGFEYFKYIGAFPEREFCQLHYGKIYHISEIRKMNNGQGLPVEYYCGGYRCKHAWGAVTKGRAENAKKNISEITKKADLLDWMDNNVAYNVNLPEFSASQTENFKIMKNIAETIYNHRIKHNLPLLNELIEDKRYSGQNAFYSSVSDSIGIGKEVLKYMDINYRNKLKSQDIDLKDAHSYFYSNNLEDVLIHELGHRTHNYFKSDINKIFKTSYSKYFNECTERAKTEIDKNTQLAEMVAEYYSLFFHKVKISNELITLFEGLKL